MHFYLINKSIFFTVNLENLEAGFENAFRIFRLQPGDEREVRQGHDGHLPVQDDQEGKAALLVEVSRSDLKMFRQAIPLSNISKNFSLC